MKCAAFTNSVQKTGTSVSKFLSIVLAALQIFTIPLQGHCQDSLFIVNSTSDDDDPNAGEPGHKCTGLPGDSCSLRAAIENHNANRINPQNRITFAIKNAPGSGSIVIKVGSTGLGQLPPVLGSVVISAINDPGDGSPTRRIEIDGSMAGSNAIGLQLLGGQCEISFFIINSFSSHGIFIGGTPPPGDGGHKLESNYIGTDSSGTVGKGNGGDGIFIDNTPNNMIGGTGLLRNLISANSGYGIHILGRDSTVTFQPNGGKNNTAQGNIIGYDVFQQNLLPNGQDGVLLEDAPSNTIGGTGNNQGNKIGSAAGNNGISIKGSLAEGILIQGNFIGEDGVGAKFKAGVFARGGKQLTVEGNIITNIDSVGIDLFMDASGNYNILKNRFDGDMKIGSKFRFGAGPQVNITYQNNFHLNNGTAFDAQESLSGTINWVVAGDTIRSGQTGANIIFNAAGDKNFSTNRWEGTAGVGFTYAANVGPGITAKLTQTSELFANNAQEGVSGKITAGGEFAVTMADLIGSSNGKDGCRLDFAVGASASVVVNSTGNKYTLNGFAGLRLVSDGNNLDLIQVFIEKDNADRNVQVGINAFNMKLKHSIAGSSITNNGGPGIELDGTSDVRIDSNTITGNGTGILINDAAVGTINDNTITGNGKGIALAGTGTGIAIVGNSIYNNTGLAIDLGNDGVTPNHSGGPIPGPNNFQNHPILTGSTIKDGDTIINGSLNSAANAVYRLDFFANDACNPTGFGDGQNFLGFKMVTTDGAGNISFSDTVTGVSVQANSFITSTATDSNGSTSEFSACILPNALPLHLLSFTATSGGDLIYLNWKTASEQDTKYFAVERSGSGNNFDTVGQVQAAGNAPQERIYTFVDRSPLQGSNFYRLQMVDLDGRFTYSKTVIADMNVLSDVFIVFPNPASNELGLELSGSGLYTITILNVDGRVMKKGSFVSSQNLSARMDISMIPKGIYIMKAENAGQARYQRFVKD
jgi:CSLREA domain-containing protein